MLPEEACSAISSKMRLEILKIISIRENKSDSIKELLKELNHRGFRVKYRASVYRALEKLSAAGFLKKYYDSEAGGIRYKLLGTHLEVDLKKGTATLCY